MRFNENVKHTYVTHMCERGEADDGNSLPNMGMIVGILEKSRRRMQNVYACARELSVSSSACCSLIG